jgi:hypothetical protein
MAAVTIDARYQDQVEGAIRKLRYQIDIAADGDTLDVPLRQVYNVIAVSQTNNAIGFTQSQAGQATRIAFQTGGAENNVRVTVEGR